MRAACFPGDGDADPASLSRAAALRPLLAARVAQVSPGGAPRASPASAPLVSPSAAPQDAPDGPPRASLAAAPQDSSGGTPQISPAVAWVAPAAAAWQTAVAMGREPRVCAALAEADCGRWRGLPYERVAREEPEALTRWLSDPHAAPHGGESRAALAHRVATWLDTERAATRPTIAICDVGAIRAALGHALGLDPTATARFDVAPLSATELVAAPDGWRVAYVNRKV